MSEPRMTSSKRSQNLHTDANRKAVAAVPAGSAWPGLAPCRRLCAGLPLHRQQRGFGKVHLRPPHSLSITSHKEQVTEGNETEAR